MALTKIASLLKDTIGMDAASIGLSAVEHALKERLSASHLKDPDVYFKRLRTSAAELQALIEAVVVPETWFFRDPGAFAALAQIARDWSTSTSPDVVRLLSVPSSTGEEPYSMAIALLDAGFPANRFRIDAIDVSTRALARAERAVYGKNSFRGSGMTGRERHFESTADGYRLRDNVRRQVKFQQGNLLSPAFSAGANIYDIVFCRNLLIYFDRTTQDRTVTVLEGLLKAKGLLFVGSAESGVFLNRSFASAQMPMAFAFHKAKTESRQRKPKTLKRVFRQPNVVPAPRVASVSSIEDESAADVWRSVGNETSETESGVSEAVHLANQGRFVEAAVCCEEYLLEHGPSAEAFHLLGLVRDASGNSTDAATYYRKALYLDPGHQDAVVHLALLMDKQGQTAEAQVLWNRARRLSKQASR